MKPLESGTMRVADGVGRDERWDDEFRALRAEVADLRERNAALEAALELVDDAVFVKDRQGRYRMRNTAGARLLGRSAEEVVGKDDTELFSPEAAGRIVECDRQIIAEGASRTFEEVATSAGVARMYRTTKASPTISVAPAAPAPERAR
jgi:PAS domain S-box-containing protein